MSVLQKKISLSEPILNALKNNPDLKAVVYARAAREFNVSVLVSDELKIIETATSCSDRDSSALIREQNELSNTPVIYPLNTLSEFYKEDIARIQELQALVQANGLSSVSTSPSDNVGASTFNTHGGPHIKQDSSTIYGDFIVHRAKVNGAVVNIESDPINTETLTTDYKKDPQMYELMSYKELLRSGHQISIVTDSQKIGLNDYVVEQKIKEELLETPNDEASNDDATDNISEEKRLA